MDADFVFNRFLNYLISIRKYSSHTQLSYQNDLTQFRTFLLSEFNCTLFHEINYRHIRSWIADLLSHEMSARTVNRKISSLKSLYRFALKEGITDKNPLNKIQAPKTSKRLPVYVEKSGMEKLNVRLSEQENTFENTRDRLIIELLYCTGMRLSECIGLKQDDIDTNRLTMKVLGKRNKERIIPFTSELAHLLDSYLKLKFEKFPQSEYIILTNKGMRAYPKFIYRVVNENLSTVSTLKKRSPHVLRHTFATHLLNNGAELNAIKELLGHSNLAATQVYTHNSIERLKEVHKSAHPKS